MRSYRERTPPCNPIQDENSAKQRKAAKSAAKSGDVRGRPKPAKLRRPTMDPVTLFLVMIAALFLLGAIGEVIFAKTQIPDVVWLILAGVILGPITGLVSSEILEQISPYFAALTLIIVLFEGGSRLVLKDLVQAAPRATLLALLSFVLTVFVVAGIAWLLAVANILEGWTAMHGVMLGAIIGGSSSLIIMPSMSLARVEEKVGSLVSLESALTDALCVVVTIAMIDVIVAGSASASAALLILAKNFGIALAIGLVAGWMWMPVLRVLAGNPHAYPMTLAALILLYVFVDASGGSAAMGILAFAVMVGNANAIMKRLGFSMGQRPLELDSAVRTVHTQIAFIVKSFFFTFIGLMLRPPWSLLAIGIVLGLVLLGARVPAVWLATRRAGFSRQQVKMITISLPRGMAAGVLATLPFHSGVIGTENLPSMVFAAVLTSILIFAVGFPLVRNQKSQAQPSEDPNQQVTAAVPEAVEADPGGGATPLVANRTSEAVTRPLAAVLSSPPPSRIPTEPSGHGDPSGLSSGTPTPVPAEADAPRTDFAVPPADVDAEPPGRLPAIANEPVDAPPASDNDPSSGTPA